MSLFGRFNIVNQLRERDSDVFFSPKNQLYTPSLSDHNNIRLGKKSNLIEYIKHNVFTESVVSDCKIFNGVTLVHSLKPQPSSRFTDYIENVFIRHIKRELECFKRIDIACDQYFLPE